MTAGATTRLVPHATCLGCGCACDDIEVVVADDRIVEARHACALGAAWFGDGRVPARALVSGVDAPLDDALDAAARLLAGAERPLVYLAPELSCEAQRAGIGLADALRATLDSITSATVMEATLAAQERGRPGATLGEIRNRGDVVVFWGVDPAQRYPRFWSRYAPEPEGLHVPEGRRSRTVVAVDVDDARGPSDADLRIAVSAELEVAALTAMRALVTMAPVRAVMTDASPWVLARALVPVLIAAHYAVLVHDAEPWPGRDPDRAAALIALAQALNAPTRCALGTLRGGGNRSGADAVATSQTGYPMAIDFARGVPRYRPYDGGAGARLARGEVDAALVIGDAAALPVPLRDALKRVPRAVVGPRASESALAAGAAAIIDTGVAGIHEDGTALRMDDVPLPLRPSVAGPPAAATLVRALYERVARTGAETGR